MSYEDTARDELLNGETAEAIRLVQSGAPGHWLIVLDYGWDETTVASCDDDDTARGVAAALAHTLDCPVVYVDEVLTP